MQERLDHLLVSRGLTESREQAARLILAGAVFVDGRLADKSGQRVVLGASVEIKARPPFVSRGGEKLAHGLHAFGVGVGGRTCLDVGSSTGGFTDCLLSRGASRVYAVDVGAGQLDARLRADPRVVVMEKTNARRLTQQAFVVEPDLATVDVAFISLEKVLPAVMGVLADPAEAIVLVKPQFEVGKGRVGKGGVVRDPAQHRAVLERVARFAILHGWHVLGLAASPLKGPKGNREFLLHLSRRGRTVAELDSLIARVAGGGDGG
ncbi:MAG: TlyA family RNA methyltransferase [Candidatus Rokubacteria bacterium]|nr:TlyA family RNA methyltransferase [Candidatus Rokubacteria bacterium]